MYKNEPKDNLTPMERRLSNAARQLKLNERFDATPEEKQAALDKYNALVRIMQGGADTGGEITKRFQVGRPVSREGVANAFNQQFPPNQRVLSPIEQARHDATQRTNHSATGAYHDRQKFYENKGIIQEMMRQKALELARQRAIQFSNQSLRNLDTNRQLQNIPNEMMDENRKSYYPKRVKAYGI